METVTLRYQTTFKAQPTFPTTWCMTRLRVKCVEDGQCYHPHNRGCNKTPHNPDLGIFNGVWETGG